LCNLLHLPYLHVRNEIKPKLATRGRVPGSWLRDSQTAEQDCTAISAWNMHLHTALSAVQRAPKPHTPRQATLAFRAEAISPDVMRNGGATPAAARANRPVAMTRHKTARHWSRTGM